MKPLSSCLLVCFLFNAIPYESARLYRSISSSTRWLDMLPKYVYDFDFLTAHPIFPAFWSTLWATLAQPELTISATARREALHEKLFYPSQPVRSTSDKLRETNEANNPRWRQAMDKQGGESSTLSRLTYAYTVIQNGIFHYKYDTDYFIMRRKAPKSL